MPYTRVCVCLSPGMHGTVSSDLPPAAGYLRFDLTTCLLGKDDVVALITVS